MAISESMLLKLAMGRWAKIVACLGCALIVVGCSGGSKNSNDDQRSGAGSDNSQNGMGGDAGVNAMGSTGGSSAYDPNNPTVGDGGTPITKENPTGETIEPFEAISAQAYLRKVKNLLTGLAPTASEVKAVTSASDPSAALKDLIDDWMAMPEHEGKMRRFFINAFQQTGFTPTEDFKPQLLENGGFDLGPLGVYGDDAFPKLIDNLEESFARTAWDIVSSGHPFTEVLTTHTFMMTTALQSLYLQIEMPNDQPFNFSFGMNQPAKLAWSIDMSGTAIPLMDTLDANSANYMIFDDERPTLAVGFELQPTCNGDARVNAQEGYALLFQRLIGFTPRYPFSANPECWEHASKPYFTADDLSDWRPVTIVPLGSGEAYVEPYDLPTLRQSSELALALPRVGFYTTPAFLALWSTNDSNQHRVTANQTLLAALGVTLTPDSTVVPASTVGLDAQHAVDGSECQGCHKILDPLRTFWDNQLDYNDRNDFPSNSFGGTSNPRPAAKGGSVAIANVNASGASMDDLGGLLLQVQDQGDPAVSRFAIAMAQSLCYWADSAQCSIDDPEFRRVAAAFESSKFDFKTLIRELFASPLVTGAETTVTFERRNVDVSISRRDHLCAALSNRLGVPDLCALSVAFPYSSGFGSTSDSYATDRARFRIAGSVAADGFSRGSETPVTPSSPTLFYRAASELLCESAASQAVDATGSPFSSSDATSSINKMVEVVMGYAPGDSHHDSAVTILNDHFTQAQGSGASATDALRSTFSLACQSPTSVAMGI